ncbi:hypothetical protein EZ456_09735 [Pedobacter psychrodurus]|uniref:Uncharacterized protein n=1 Tax=Pedobacter psychrodurus TaxID=2530456 RepID=A0A4R0PXC5_9SPHI|nr:hypothetical protein [Pedobacter psychrodurus]TCD27463.1 hypothetical protein EZ456_09735 [Pedobacter psychrodurus]
MLIVCPFILISTGIFKEKTGREISFYFLKFWAWSLAYLPAYGFLQEVKKLIRRERTYAWATTVSFWMP